MRRTLLAAVAVLGVVASSCARADRGIVVGAVYPTSGPQGMGGSDEYRGVELAADYVNAKGGVRGRRIAIDLRSAPSAESVPDAVDALQKKGAAVVLGSHGSTLSAVAARATAGRVVFWETGAVGELPARAAGGRTFFRVAPTGSSLGRAAVAFVRDQLLDELGAHGTLRYGVAYVDDAYGRAVGGGAIREIARTGRAPKRFAYDAQGTNYPALARRIAVSDVDVLVVAAYLDDGVGLRRASVRAGVPLVASIGTSSSYCMPEFGKALGKDAVGLFASDKPDGPALRTDGLTPEAAEAFRWLTKEYRARYHDDVSAPALAGFAGAWGLFRYVLPKSKQLSPAAVAAAARTISLRFGSLPNGSGLDFADGGDNLRATSVTWEWVKPGVRQVVWPPAFATHDIVALRPA